MPKILVIDDCKEHDETLQFLFAEHGIHMDRAENLTEGLRMLKTENYCLVFLEPLVEGRLDEQQTVQQTIQRLQRESNGSTIYLFTKSLCLDAMRVAGHLGVPGVLRKSGLADLVEMRYKVAHAVGLAEHVKSRYIEAKTRRNRLLNALDNLHVARDRRCLAQATV